MPLDFFSAGLLGVIQGITEWLPISSKSQVTIAGQLLGIPASDAFSIAIFLHIGTVLAATWFFRKDIIQILQQKDKPLLKFLVIALVGTAITGLPAYWLTQNYLVIDAVLITLAIGFFLVLSGVLQWWTQNRPGARCEACNELTPKNGLVLGLCQGLAGLPGVSRSGITVSALLLESFSPEQAFRISFLLSIPSVIGLELFKTVVDPIAVSIELLAGTLMAFIFGIVSLHVLMKIAHRVSFAKFAIGFGVLYLILAGLMYVV